MIRGLFTFWFLPIAIFWSWYFASSNDLGPDSMFFSRVFYDRVFGTYGAVLGIDPGAIPGMVAKALVVDTAIVFGLIVLRRHRSIARFVAARLVKADRRSVFHADLVSASEDSLSKAP
ncbi:hypothetical protein ASG43_08265 [Aureimonas sp. Leaf454]|uniref:DUF6105 family protein n=1 Tax=Aureimonas sp. Leaf454 TaxID=1736381 RepID=UPI0006FC082D|nr:DUF6105 family protein [Aureimonas sp. Leaf454]KQT48828.1 hypothetical protein ASG43_08265 [Aureimonas sp. Leaf454]